ncbi:hypothetical protein Poly41_09360 [Novipirellula artificiosorum]|uniref:Uncharacterized protein n=1 Tax=Novipirellula artificiosorum TaxID=2528016 RepID=A0A5C6E3T0_9BACT|nr:hypothetical protein Poly41_09360 [Novipirellula artificiosorum]
MSDDHATSAISAYGSDLLQTPSIDRVAAEGVRSPELGNPDISTVWRRQRHQTQQELKPMRLIATSLALILVAAASVASAEEPLQREFGTPEPLPQELHSFNSNLLMATALHGIRPSLRYSELSKMIRSMSTNSCSKACVENL